MNDLFHQYQNYILLGFAFAVLAILSKLESVRSAIASIWAMVQAVISFVGDAFRESGDKTSYSRLAGAFVIFKITSQTENIPEEWMTLFMFLIGYQLISGLLRDNPAILELIKAKYTLPQAPKQNDQPPTV